MSDILLAQQNEHPDGAPRKSGEMGIFLLGALILFMSFGATMLVFSLLYVRDVQTLQQLPNQIWALICGVPSDNEIILPLLVLMSTLSFCTAAGLWGFHKLRR